MFLKFDRFLSFSLQFWLDCRFGTNYTDIVLREGIKSMMTRKVFVPAYTYNVLWYCSTFRRACFWKTIGLNFSWFLVQALVVSSLPHISQKCSIKIDLRSRRKWASLDDLGCWYLVSQLQVYFYLCENFNLRQNNSFRCPRTPMQDVNTLRHSKMITFLSKWAGASTFK